MLEPGNIEEVQEAVRDSDALIPIGGNTKPALTSVPDRYQRISLKRLSGILEYDPGEFTITVLAGTPLKEIQDVLREQGQYLPFDPPLASEGASIGGTVAAGLSGPGAYRFGPIRDFLIGVRYLDSDARGITGGGKVVKNAAGFDTPKFLIGSLGRLGILIELTFKVFPEPEARSTFSIKTNDSQHAAELIAQLSCGTFDLEALDYEANTKVVRGRLAGNAKAIENRLPMISQAIDQPDHFTVLDPAKADALWNQQLGFSWIDPALSLAKFATTRSSIKAHDAMLENVQCTIHYSIGGNLAWVNAPLELLGTNSYFEKPGLLIRTPSSEEASIWTKPLQTSEILKALKKALDEKKKFPSLDDST